MKRIDTLWSDVVFATRLLRKAPIFTTAVVLTFALGVGVNTAVFSVVNAIVLRPLPVRDSDRLVVIASQNRSSRTLHAMSLPDVEDYRAATGEVLEDVAGYRVGFLGLAPDGGRPARVLVTWVTGNYFPLLDIRPALGRLIQQDEGRSGRADAVVVLGYSTWQRRFAADPDVVGKKVRVNGHPCTIVGVVPAPFVGTFAFSESELYLPLNWRGTENADSRDDRSVHAIARLRPAATVGRAQATMDVVAERLARQYPDSNENIAVRVLPERFARPEEDQFRTNKVGATIMLGMVGLVMIIAAVNAANLLMARATGRRQELAIRAALGAGRGRIIRQFVTESLMFAAAGGCAGAVLGAWAAQALATIGLPGDLPVRFDFELDGRVLAYSASVALVSGILAGVVPAIRASGADLDQTLRQSRYASSSAIHSRRNGGALVAVQIAFCFVLLAVAALFARSLFKAERTDFGFRADGVLNVHMDVGQLGYSEARGRAFFEEVERSVESLPGVRSVSFAFTIPMGYIRVSTELEADGHPVDSSARVSAGQNVVSPDYFRTMDIPLLRGRSFSDRDTQHSRLVAMVNEHLAGILWPGRDPIGRRFRAGGPDEAWFEVVGVTTTGKYRFLFEDPLPYFYVPVAQHYTGLRVLHVRTSTSPEALAPAVERAIRQHDLDLPLYDVQSMTRALGSGLGLFPVRIGAAFGATLGFLAVMLAIVGLYGVVSYLANQRTHEIGVRLAIGANRGDIIRLVARDGLRLVVVGLAVGLLITLVVSRAVGTFLFGISPRDPVTLISVAAMLGSVALIACAIPAWRAARVDPTVALRSE